VLVTHVGGVYDDREASRARWIEGWEQCPEHVRNRLVLENDDIRFSAADVLWIHERTGVRLVFDYQHFWCLNPERLEMRPTLEKFLASWPEGVRPKIHFSSPRTEMREVKRQITAKQRAAAKKTGTAKARKGEVLKAPVKATARIKTVLLPPIWTGHADFTNPFEFATFMRMAEGLEFDVMMEGKSKDISLLKLKPDLLRFAPTSRRGSASCPRTRPRSRRRRSCWRRRRGGDRAGRGRRRAGGSGVNSLSSAGRGLQVGAGTCRRRSMEKIKAAATTPQ
jgi:UV DNA damage endonuclease